MQLIDKIRERMGFPQFIKIDPNTQETKADAGRPETSHQRLGQAAITAILVGIYKYSRSEGGFEYLLAKDQNIPWTMILFGQDEVKVVSDVASYAGISKMDARTAMQEAGDTAWQVAEEDLKDHFSFEQFSNLFNSMRNDILHYLPAALNLGKRLNDTSIDDRTNKMEGPVSGMMHKIEKLFSQPQ